MKQLLASLTAAAFLLTGTAMAGAAPKAKTTTTKAVKSTKPMAKLKTAKTTAMKPAPKATKNPWAKGKKPMPKPKPKPTKKP